MTEHVVNQALIAQLESFIHPQDLIREIFHRFGKRAAIGTSGQLTGSAMIDMAVAAGVKPRVFTIDTLRLFPETYQLFDQIEKKIGNVLKKFEYYDLTQKTKWLWNICWIPSQNLNNNNNNNINNPIQSIIQHLHYLYIQFTYLWFCFVVCFIFVCHVLFEGRFWFCIFTD